MVTTTSLLRRQEPCLWRASWLHIFVSMPQLHVVIPSSSLCLLFNSMSALLLTPATHAWVVAPLLNKQKNVIAIHHIYLIRDPQLCSCLYFNQKFMQKILIIVVHLQRLSFLLAFLLCKKPTRFQPLLLSEFYQLVDPHVWIWSNLSICGATEKEQE